MPWNPTCYEQFKAERYAPFADALNLVEKKPHLQAVDLGCGTGELTEWLFRALPDAQMTGIDSSAEMLAQATSRQALGLNFYQGNLAEVEGSWDLVFSHAALQWVEAHETLIPRLFELVRPGGQLVVQMPSNHGHISHRLIQETAQQEPYYSALQGWQRQSPVLPVGRYAEILHECGGTHLVVFEKIYPHVLKNAQAIVDWVKGTALVPYLERLTPDLQDDFLKAIHHQLQEKLSQTPVFYGFQRILFSAFKPV